MKTPKLYTINDNESINQKTVSDFQVSYSSMQRNDEQLHQLSKRGVTKEYLENVANKLGLTIYEIAPLLHLSSRTLLRYQPAELMDTPVSEHLILLDKLITEGCEVLGNDANFKEWLHSKIRAFEFEKPIQLLDTIFGIQMVNQILGRIKYGVYS
jgi:putative toxin-antitoxin system antitoxin component (TIGR02293 family)